MMRANFYHKYYGIDQVIDTFILFRMFSVVNDICKKEEERCCPVPGEILCVGGGECCEGLECKKSGLWEGRCIKGNRCLLILRKLNIIIIFRILTVWNMNYYVFLVFTAGGGPGIKCKPKGSRCYMDRECCSKKCVAANVAFTHCAWNLQGQCW